MKLHRISRRALVAWLATTPLGLLFGGVEPARASPGKVGDLVVKMRRFRNAKGKVRVGLYRRAEDWPKAGRAFRAAAFTLQRRYADFVFENVPHGEYAVAVLHDEDGDGDMDYSIIGVPTEGFGFSRDAPVSFGPPDFDDAKIILSKAHKKLRIKIRYMF